MKYCRNNNVGIIVCMFLILIDFFGLVVFPSSRPLKVVELIGLFYVTFSVYDRKNKIETCFIAIAFFVTASVCYSYFVNHQKFFSVLAVSFHYYGLLSYFILKFFKTSTNQTWAIIKHISILMIVMYIFQWLVYPFKIFESAGGFEININEGLFRMRFVCSICSYLVFFWGLNKLYIKPKFLYLRYIALGFFPMMMMGFRSLLFMSVCSVLLMLFFTTKKLVSYSYNALLVFLLVVFVSQIPIVQNKINEMTTRQKSDQVFENEDYVRWIGLDYYETLYSKDKIQRIIGGGIPLVTLDGGKEQKSNKYQNEVEFGMKKMLYWNDLGLIGLSYMIGIPAVLLMIILCVYYMWKCKSPDLQYIRFTLFSVLIASIMTSMELYRAGNLLIVGAIFYYVDRRELLSINGNAHKSRITSKMYLA